VFTLKLEGSFSEAEKKQACNLLQADKAVESDRTPNITGNVATVATPHTELDGESVRLLPIRSRPKRHEQWSRLTMQSRRIGRVY